MAEKKLTFKIALLGLLGAGAVGYAFLRRPRYLYDGLVQACEGTPPLMGIDQKCSELALSRSNGSGKIFAPFDGSVTESANGLLTIKSKTEPTLFHFKLDRGAPMLSGGQSFKSGDILAQAERVKVSASRDEGGLLAPMSPSAWLIANALVPASQHGSLWCEDSYQVIVPHCAGITFRAPTLPKWSLRTVRMTM